MTLWLLSAKPSQRGLTRPLSKYIGSGLVGKVVVVIG